MSAMFSEASRVTIMKAMVAFLTCIGLAFGIAVRADATPVVLTFEGAGDQAYVDQFYNGGTDSAGHAGSNYGVEFGNAAIGQTDFAAGGSNQYGGEPSPVTVLLFLNTGQVATMNVAAGFDTGFSFFYAAPGIVGPHPILVYDGLNATGNVLATLNLGRTDACSDSTDCPWVFASAAFSGIAHSVDFAASDAQIAFDNITLNLVTQVGPTPVPEPAALGTMVSGLALLAILYRRRRLS